LSIFIQGTSISISYAQNTFAELNSILLICMAPCQAPKDLANQILHSQSYQSAAAHAKLDVGSMKFLSVPAAEFFSGTLKNQMHKISASFPDVL